MRKKISMLLLIVILGSVLSGCGLFQTVSGMNGNQETQFTDAKDLEEGKAYVWSQDEVFQLCITGNYNFKKRELETVSEHPRSIWIGSEEDEQIPTVTSEDYLVYVSKEEIPEKIVFERFADYGYTIGVSNLIADLGGHYYITYAVLEEDDYKYYLDLESDAAQLTELEVIERLYLDQVGEFEVTKERVSNGGTILGLEKDKEYVCEFYTGTYYQDYILTANVRSFGSMEQFESYDYEFMHSNFIKVEIPEYFKSGYYFVNGVGLFRYVADEDIDHYNGKSYDEEIDWNVPIILYNEDGTLQYDPTRISEEVDIEAISDPGDNGEVEVQMELPAEREEIQTE